MKNVDKKMNLQVPLRYVKLNIRILAAVFLVFILFVYIWPLMTTFDMSWMWAQKARVHNVLEPGFEPKKDGKSIFFLETNKAPNNTIRLNSRQSCSIEAAGKQNYRKIYS